MVLRYRLQIEQLIKIMPKLLLIIITVFLYAACSDKSKLDAALQKTKQNAIDSVGYTNMQQAKVDSLDVSRHDTAMLRNFEGPAMTPLGDAPKKKTTHVKKIKTRSHSTVN